MTQRWLTFDMRTGRKLRYLPTEPSNPRWQRRLNDAGTLSCTVPLTADTALLNLRESTRPARTGLAVLEGAKVIQAGPIWGRSYRKDQAELVLTAAGAWSYFDHRFVAKAVLESQVIAGAIDAESADWTLSFAASSYSDIARGLIAEALAWSGGDLPFVLPDVTGGVHEKTYRVYNFGSVAQRLWELTQLQDGSEIRFLPRFNIDRDGIEFELQVGDPELTAPRELRWNAAAARTPISGLQIDEDGAKLAGLGWALGGRQEDSTLVQKVLDPTLTDLGYPLLETVNREHLNVIEATTLEGYLNEELTRARRSTEVWSFNIRKDRPAVGSYLEGDHVSMVVRDDPYIPNGRYALKIVSLSGTDSDLVTVGCELRGV